MIGPLSLIRSRAALAMVAASFTAVSVAGCDLGRGEGTGISPREQRALDDLRPVPRKLLRIDEFAGAYAGVGLGDSVAEVMKVFGPAPKIGGDYGPLDSDASGTGSSSDCGGRGRDYDFLRYRGVSYWVYRGAVCIVDIEAERVETRRGVAVGDRIDEVDEAYPELTCRISDHPEFRDYRYCLGRLGPRRFIWFSGFVGEPIDGIELGVYPFCEACVRKPSFYR